jgi:hypothetical protein
VPKTFFDFGSINGCENSLHLSKKLDFYLFSRLKDKLIGFHADDNAKPLAAIFQAALGFPPWSFRTSQDRAVYINFALQNLRVMKIRWNDPNGWFSRAVEQIEFAVSPNHLGESGE